MAGKDGHKKLHQIFEGGEMKQEQRTRHISFLFADFYSSVTAAVWAFLVARVAASFADTALSFNGLFNSRH